MYKKLTATLLSGVFVFILAMTAWDYCGRLPKQPRLETQAALAQSNQIKFNKAHHPCASLKSPYDLVSTFRVSTQETLHTFKLFISRSGKCFFVGKRFFANDLSPPFENPSPLAVPIFQLNSNLRI